MDLVEIPMLFHKKCCNFGLRRSWEGNWLSEHTQKCYRRCWEHSVWCLGHSGHVLSTLLHFFCKFYPFCISPRRILWALTLYFTKNNFSNKNGFSKNSFFSKNISWKIYFWEKDIIRNIFSRNDFSKKKIFENTFLF